MLVVVLGLILAGKLVPGSVYERECRKNDTWADQIPQLTNVVSRAVDAFRDGRPRG